MKHLYDLLNKVDMNVEEYEEVELSRAEKDRLVHTLRKRVHPPKKKYQKVFVAAAFVLATASPIMLSNDQVWASLSKAGKQIEQFFNKPENQFIGYKQKSEQTATDQNIDVTLNEFMLDDGQILLSLNVNAEHLNKKALGANPKAPIRPGELIVNIGDVTFANSAHSVQLEDEKTEDGSWNYLYSFDLNSIDTDGDRVNDKDDFQILDHMDSNKEYGVDITFLSMEYEKEGGVHSGKYSDSFGQIKGNWAFKTKVNGENIKSDTEIYSVDKKIKIRDKDVEGILQIKEIRVSPVSLKIHYTFEYTKGDASRKNIDLRVEDGEGKRLLGSGTGTGTDKISTMDAEYPLDDNVAQIKITPVLFDYKSESEQILKDNAFDVQFKH